MQSRTLRVIVNDQRPCDEYVKQPQLLEIDGKYNGYFTSNESFVPFSSQEGGIGYMNITVQNPNNKIITVLILDNETDQYKSNGVLDASSTTKNYKDEPFNDLSPSFLMANQQ
ncbi:1720_t:CDS:2, partial [Gigaspora rosea]